LNCKHNLYIEFTSTGKIKDKTQYQ